MKYILTLFAVFALNIATAPANAAAMNMSDTATVGNISVSAAWSRASAGMKRAGAAFLTISNSGTTGDRLIAASTPAAAKAELHTHLMDNGVMKMRQIMAIDIPAGSTVQLKPGGMHVMLFKLTKTFEQGAHYPLTLTFEKAGDVTLMVPVGKAGAMGNMKHQGMMQDCTPLKGDKKKKCMEKSAMPNN